jgi:hypothetical protein
MRALIMVCEHESSHPAARGAAADRAAGSMEPAFLSVVSSLHGLLDNNSLHAPEPDILEALNLWCSATTSDAFADDVPLACG